MTLVEFKYFVQAHFLLGELQGTSWVTAWNKPHFSVFLFCLQPPRFSNNSNSGRSARVLGREKMPGQAREKVQVIRGLVLKPFSRTKLSPEFWILLLNKDCDSRLLIVHEISWYNVGRMYTEYYVHYTGCIFSIFLEDRVFIYILHLVECNTLIYDKQAVQQGGSAGGKGGRREFNRNNST